MASPSLAVVRRGQQAIDEVLVGVRRPIVHERLHLFERRLVAEQIDVGARHERAFVGLRRGLELLLGELGEHEVVDLVGRSPCDAISFGAATRLHRLEGPPLASVFERHALVLDEAVARRRCGDARVDRAARNPLREVRQQRVRKLAGGRHLDERVFVAQRLHQKALGRFARHHHRTGHAALEQAFLGVEDQIALRRDHRRAVALVAALDEHRPNLRFEELDLRRLRKQRRRCGHRKNTPTRQ